MTRIALVSTSDTDLLSARASGADYRYANPSKVTVRSLAPDLGGSDLIRPRGCRHDRVIGSLVRLDLERGPSDPDLVTRTHRDGASDPLPVDEGAVGRVEVFDDHRSARAS